MGKLASEWVDVRVMLPAGASPAMYEPTLPQLRAIADAALYVKVGHPHFPFEQAWLDDLLAQNAELVVLDGSAGVSERKSDPHVWLVPRHVRSMCREIARALVVLLPDRAAEIEANHAAFEREIEELDREIRRQLADVQGREFFVFHPAWGYFAREYGLVQVSVEDEHKEPDLRQLARLIERARALGVGTIFVQPQFDPESARVLAREIGARVEPLDPLAFDWSANLRDAARRVAASLAS